LFRELGYHRVAIEDIAASVGITGRAIYRHFATKQELLDAVIAEATGALEAAGTVDAIAELSLDRREIGVLVEREARHSTLATRPAPLGDGFLCQSALTVLLSPSHHSVVLPPARAHHLLTSMARCVLTAPESSWSDARATPATAPRASRREAVLSAAVDLFAERGYAAVRMEDVGAGAGIAGPSVYEHFESKADLLMAALTRGAEWLQLGIAQALATPGSDADRLAAALQSYVDFTIDHSALMGVFLTESIYLPDDERHALRRMQHRYVSEWVSLLIAARPTLGAAEARFIVHGALSLVNNCVANVRPGLGPVLVGLGRRVLEDTT
jgi:AcrR family transcriptional regulator